MSKNDRNNSTTHIILNRFSVAEKQIIRKAIASQQMRRPAFYHDAIIAYAKEITDESNVTKASGNLPPSVGGTREEADCT